MNSEHMTTQEAASLAHIELVEKSRVVMRLGQSLLACGAGAYRVKSAMSRAARAVGLTRHEAQVALMEITTTSWQGDNFRTEVTENRNVGVNVKKLDKLMTLCVRLHHDMSVEELDAELDRIDSEDSHYPLWGFVLAAAFACAAFSFLNDGRVVECSTVFFAAGAGQWARVLMNRRNVSHFAIWLVCAAISTLIYIGVVGVLHSYGLVDGMHHAGVMSSFLYLIPGFPLVTAILDFARMDFWSALTRINYCMMVIASAGISVWVVSHLLSWSVEGIEPAPMAPALLLTFQAISSFVASYGFAVLFNAPWKVAGAAGTIGAVINSTRFLLQGQGMPWQMAVGFAALLAGIFAMAIAKRTHHSRVSLSVPAVVIMIPGVPFYQALVALNEGDYVSALGPVSTVFFVVMSIGIGLALSRMLTDPGWFYNADTNKLDEDLEKTKRNANF